jgi:uncharacterized protein (TIGR03437 family)
LKRLSTVLIALVTALLAAPVVAQTQIGGGVCSSATLNGTYALSFAARQVNNSGTFLNVLESNGSATFDGQSGVTITEVEDTIQAVGTPVSSQGSYSVQANCTAVVSIANGATFDLAIYNQGKDFLLSGYDANYSYTGSGALPAPQPLSCSSATLSGTYTFNSTGYALTGGAVSGAANVAGLVQFDGQGNLSANVTTASVGNLAPAATLTGTYTIASTCLGTATLTDSSSNSYVMAFGIYTATTTNQNFFASLARSGRFLVSGEGHNISPQASTSTTCSASNLKGSYALSVSGRNISVAGTFGGAYQGIGTVTFDGNGSVSVAGTANSNLAQGSPFSYSGTYTLAGNCSGTLSAAINGTASFVLVVWGAGTDFAMVGADSSYVYSMTGSGNSAPPACSTATISGEYTFATTGFTESGTTATGVQDGAGVLQFDGLGNVTAKLADSQGGTTPLSETASGSYTVGPGCSASATLKDSAGNSNALNFVIGGPYGQTLDLLAANAIFVRSGSAHSPFNNPSQAIGNVASYAYSATPPGSVFALFGQNLATKAAGAVTTTLPTKLLNTTVTVNGELAPLFYVEPGQIDAQMPWDIPGNAVASVVVTNGTSTSNAAAVYVPATGTPGISTYGNNRAVMMNADGTINSATYQASVGDEVVVYFTGGGPVQASGTLTTGAPAPPGLSVVTEDNSITVGGQQARVVYMGLTPGSIGLYQANFIVPQIAKGAYPVVITIDGYASNNPVMNVSN